MYKDFSFLVLVSAEIPDNYVILHENAASMAIFHGEKLPIVKTYFWKL